MVTSYNWFRNMQVHVMVFITLEYIVVILYMVLNYLCDDEHLYGPWKWAKG